MQSQPFYMYPLVNFTQLAILYNEELYVLHQINKISNFSSVNRSSGIYWKKYAKIQLCYYAKCNAMISLGIGSLDWQGPVSWTHI